MKKYLFPGKSQPKWGFKPKSGCNYCLVENSSIPGGMPLAGIRDTAKNALKQQTLRLDRAKGKDKGLDSVKQVIHENLTLNQAKDN